MKIALSGGHLTPALAFLDYLKESESPHFCVFFGREHAQTKTGQPSHEEEEVTARGVPFISFAAGKISTYSIFDVLLAGIQNCKAFFVALYHLSIEKPDIFLSFGTYMAVPLGYAAWVLGIPVVTHEQTRSIGFATKALSPLARKIFLSFPDSLAHVPKHKSEVTGNLLRSSLTPKIEVAPSWYHNPQELPILYVTGGSQGSEVINTCVGRLVPKLTKEYVVIHQCGSTSKMRSYSAELAQLRATLSKNQQNHYVIQEWLSAEELGWLYAHATLVVSRAGANTVQELATFQVPSILIPLPFAHNQEQLVNAQWLSQAGGAELIEQKDLTAELLFEKIALIRSKHKSYRRKLSALELPTDASHRVLQALEAICAGK